MRAKAPIKSTLRYGFTLRDCGPGPAICIPPSRRYGPGRPEKPRAPARCRKDVEGLSGHWPNQRVALHRSPTPDRKRIITTETRRIHVRMARKNTSIPLVRETPDRPVHIQFDLGTAK
jgi:hypothetical protein